MKREFIRICCMQLKLLNTTKHNVESGRGFISNYSNKQIRNTVILHLTKFLPNFSECSSRLENKGNKILLGTPLTSALLLPPVKVPWKQNTASQPKSWKNAKCHDFPPKALKPYTATAYLTLFICKMGIIEVLPARKSCSKD